jgi:hypothetical protein
MLFADPLRVATKMNSQNKRPTGPLAYMNLRDFENQFRAMWNAIFSNLYRSKPESSIHLEKTPHHCLQLNQIVHLFPKARIILLLRDSRAVTSSIVHAGRGWGDHWAPTSYRDAAILWYVYMKSFLDWRAAHPSQPCLVVRYEDALRNPAEEVHRILKFLDVACDDGTVEKMIKEYERGEAKRSDPEGFSRKRGSTGWQHDLPWYAKLVTWRYTRKMMRGLGYDCRPFK